MRFESYLSSKYVFAPIWNLGFDNFSIEVNVYVKSKLGYTVNVFGIIIFFRSFGKRMIRIFASDGYYWCECNKIICGFQISWLKIVIVFFYVSLF